jgi:hypothetical protein
MMRKPNKRHTCCGRIKQQQRLNLSVVEIENICYYFERREGQFPVTDKLEPFSICVSTFP